MLTADQEAEVRALSRPLDGLDYYPIVTDAKTTKRAEVFVLQIRFTPGEQGDRSGFLHVHGWDGHYDPVDIAAGNLTIEADALKDPVEKPQVDPVEKPQVDGLEAARMKYKASKREAKRDRTAWLHASKMACRCYFEPSSGSE